MTKKTFKVGLDIHGVIDVEPILRYGDYFKTKFMHLNLSGHRKDYKLEKLNTISDVEKWFNNTFSKKDEFAQ